jgi:hypothetical protein
LVGCQNFGSNVLAIEWLVTKKFASFSQLLCQNIAGGRAARAASPGHAQHRRRGGAVCGEPLCRSGRPGAAAHSIRTAERMRVWRSGPILAAAGRRHPRRPRRRQAKSMGPPCVRTLSLELQQNNMHVQINGNERLRQSIMMFLD